ncbi:hypothetical protein BofuT4_P064840.1 [Botrytis cinerea T4]|uniref:Ankyrin repeat protein n=1 Tax=Botryotinia fuckeliana (strain T4) TaxID=999810 RepID=G2XSK5_BOTF4|nr:hypothetical protein BofuT4_P064840.1 [Botrytis cinerea T4]
MADHAGVPVLLLTALELAEKDFILQILPEVDVIQHPKLGTALNQASFQGLLKIVSALLNRELRIPAGVNNKVECMEHLIHHGADINLVSGPQGMPLMVACYDAHLHKDVMLLLQNFRKNGPRASEEQRTVVNANISMLEWCMLRLENDQKREKRADQLSLFESVSSQPWWTEDIDTDGEQESSHHKDEIPELKYTDDQSL